MKKNFPVTQIEKEVPDGAVIVTKTDTRGIITYANDEFVELSGFDRDELLGKNHNMVRHPEMPSAAFKDLWDTVKAGYPWRGMVKNRCKNGDFYWVKATVVPIKENGAVAGYMSVRKKASRADIQQAENLYRSLNAGAHPAKPGLAQRFAHLSLRTQLQIFIQPTLLLLLTFAQVMLFLSMKDTALQNARHQADATANEIIDGANMLMMTGSISDVENRKLLIRKFTSSGDIKEARLMRAKPVVDQYGPGLPTEQIRDQVEREVIDSKKPHYEMVNDANGDPILRAVTPYFASHDFHGTNCMQCHEIKEGAVMGVSSIAVDLKDDFARIYHFQLYFAAGQVVLQLILFFFISWAIDRFVRRPIALTISEMDKIVAGDLSGEIDISGRNEMGSLLCSMQSMQTQIGVMIDRISSSSREIESKMTVMTNEIALVAKQSENQSASAMEAASAMEEISVSVNEVASSATDAAQSVSISNSKAERGNVAMANGVETSKQVVTAVSASAETIAKLEAAVNSIGNIADAIKDIADQTNLLALNAAIEAARAGEQGRGFAVVADEVRKLAEKTSASTADIGRTVSAVTGITGRAAEEMHSASVEVEKGMESVLESAKSLKEISEHSAHAMQMANHIADAVKQQASASEEIAKNLANISELSGANTEAAWRAEEQTRELGKIAHNLRVMVSFFRF